MTQVLIDRELLERAASMELDTTTRSIRTQDELRAIVAANSAQQGEVQRLREALKHLLSYAERQICEHEETHRGGAIWEICDMCGAKWADDEGGKPEFMWPDEIKAAHAALLASAEGVKDE